MYQWYTLYMGVLNLRNIPDDLIRRMKVRAAENGVSLKDECLEIIRRHCGIVDGGSGAEQFGKGSSLERSGSGGSAGVEEKRTGDGVAVPVLRKAKGAEKRLHPLQSVRGELVERGDAPSHLPKQGPASITRGSCPHGKMSAAYCRASGGEC